MSESIPKISQPILAFENTYLYRELSEISVKIIDFTIQASSYLKTSTVYFFNVVKNQTFKVVPTMLMFKYVHADGNL